jgi:CheY-like chemotaxis protein
LQPRRTDINALVTDTGRLLERTLGANIRIDLRLGADLWPVKVDGSQLQASLVNIAINARDAMPKGGTLLIQTARANLDTDYVRQHPEVAVGDYVVIEASDTGSGMPADVIAHIFEPFFTTKPPGQGTGLGLSMVYGFVKQSGGHVAAYSEVGKGSTFKLYLPRADLATEPARPQVATLVPAPASGKVVLVVDDNPHVRATVVVQLTHLGYQVIEADCAKDALVKLESAPRVDVLFTDIVMPGHMNGRELAASARAARPGIKVLFTSGFPGAWLANSKDVDPGAPLLTKPYRRRDLAKALHDLLAEPVG